MKHSIWCGLKPGDRLRLKTLNGTRTEFTVLGPGPCIGTIMAKCSHEGAGIYRIGTVYPLTDPTVFELLGKGKTETKEAV